MFFRTITALRTTWIFVTIPPSLGSLTLTLATPPFAQGRRIEVRFRAIFILLVSTDIADSPAVARRTTTMEKRYILTTVI